LQNNTCAKQNCKAELQNTTANQRLKKRQALIEQMLATLCGSPRAAKQTLRECT